MLELVPDLDLDLSRLGEGLTLLCNRYPDLSSDKLGVFLDLEHELHRFLNE